MLRSRTVVTPNRAPQTRTPAKKATTRPRTVTKSSDRGSGRAPTYDAPMFAQPGEEGDLFGYASFTGKHVLDAPFALIDFETSGFEPGSARVLEVAVLKIDSSGKVLDEYSTLINPGDGQVGRTDIHQITLGMLKNAPLMQDAIGDILEFLDSTIIVAHNAKFEERFLHASFREFGIEHPLMPTIDTLWLSRQVLKLPNYKLATVIAGFGKTIENAHTALGDVRAMAKVLPEMLRMASPIKYPTQLSKSPNVVASGKTLPRS